MRNSPFAVLTLSFMLSFPSFAARPPKQYPTDMRLVDITRDPYNAASDGSVDVSDIILQVFKDKHHDWTRPLALYFPAGTYLVDKQIRFGNCCAHLLGQGPEHTILKLAENAQGFDDPQNPRGVLRTTRSETNDTKNNTAFRNYIQDLSVVVGKDNPGAIGVEFIASNSGAVKNVTILGDQGGFCGLAMEIGWPGPLLVKDLTVNGFDYGIRVGYREYSQTYENITLLNQKIAAIYNNGNMMAIRNLQTTTAAPAIINQGNRAMVVLLDGQLGGGKSGTAAIDNSAFLYARNVSVTGYSDVIKTGDKTVAGPRVDEYFSHDHQSLFGDKRAMLHLPVKETPEFHDDNLNNWVRANDYPSVAAMEQAMSDQSKTTLYWNTWSVTRTGTLRIPANIRRIYSIDGLLNVVNGYSGDPLIISVEEESEHPLILEGLTVGKVILEQRCSRPVAILHCKGPDIPRNFPESGELFIEDALVNPKFQYPQNVWARQLNAETGNNNGVPVDMIFNPGGDWWILGLKTEGRGTIVTNTDGGRLEVLGTFVYPVRSDSKLPQPKHAFINEESSMSLMYKYYGGYTYQIKDTRGGDTKTLASADADNPFLYTSIRPEDRTSAEVRSLSATVADVCEATVSVSPAGQTTLRLTVSAATEVSLVTTDCTGRVVAEQSFVYPEGGARAVSPRHGMTGSGVYVTKLRVNGLENRFRFVVP